jgi:hypothetical protein
VTNDQPAATDVRVFDRLLAAGLSIQPPPARIVISSA